MSIILTKPNTTSTARVLITEAKKDLGADATKPKALTKVVTQDREAIELWSDTNVPLGKAGDVIDLIVTTENNLVNNRETGEPSDRYYFSFCVAPSDFFAS